MGTNSKKHHLDFACCRLSSSLTTLLLLVIPLVFVSGFVSFLGPKSSNWVFISNNNKNNSISHSTNNNYSSGNSVNVINRTIEKASSISKESLLNRTSSSNYSSPPVIEIEALSQPSHDEEIFHNGTQENSKPKIVPLAKARREKEFTHLDWLEARLMKARYAISDAIIGNQTEDPEFIPIGPPYLNAKAFHRSYLEMEKEFKVFVYEEGEPPLFHNGPCKGVYSMEGNFIHEMEMNRHFRTKDPHKAHVFFLPFSVTMLVSYVYVRDSYDFHPLRHTVNDYVNVISGKYPFWNRSLAADHFMLSCHDWGPETSKSDPNLYKNSIRVLCNANTSEGFDPSKDVSFPEINLLSGSTDGLLGGPSASHRPILAFFAGRVHGPIRPVLLEHWENKDNDMKIYKYLPKGVSYYNMLRKSKYCLCPSGYEVASPRIVEAIYTGCVPVLISDHYVPPFSDVLNWKSFTVEVAVTDIPNLKKTLMNISSSQYIRMQRRVLKVRRHFVVNSPPKRFDVFHMILHSIWLRRLNIRVHEDQ